MELRSAKRRTACLARVRHFGMTRDALREMMFSWFGDSFDDAISFPSVIFAEDWVR